MAGESPLAGAARGIVEELQVQPSAVSVRAETLRMEVGKKTHSGAFPGITCRFEVQHVDADVAGLSQQDFSTTEENDGRTIVHHWSWRPLDDEAAAAGGAAAAVVPAAAPAAALTPAPGSAKESVESVGSLLRHFVRLL